MDMGQIMTWAAEIARGKCGNLQYHPFFVNEEKFCGLQADIVQYVYTGMCVYWRDIISIV